MTAAKLRANAARRFAAGRGSASGRVVLITGPARGIGAALAEELHADGALVSLVGLEPDLLDRRAAAMGPRALWFEADVTDSASLEAAVAATLERFDRIDAVVANAGIAPPGSLTELSEADAARTIDVNLLGVWRTIRATLPALTDSAGYALSVCSLAVSVPSPYLAHYAASKAGVEALMRSLRSEVEGATGVRMGTAYLSFVDTDLFEGSVAHPSVARLHETLGPFGARIEPDRAADVLARAVAERKRKVCVPRWLGPLLLGRGPVAGLLDRFSPRVVAMRPSASSARGHARP